MGPMEPKMFHLKAQLKVNSLPIMSLSVKYGASQNNFLKYLRSLEGKVSTLFPPDNLKKKKKDNLKVENHVLFVREI